MLTSCFSKKGRMSSRAWWPIVECSCSNVLAAASLTSSKGSHSAFLTVGTRDSEKSSTWRWRGKITEHLKHNRHAYLSKVAKNGESTQLKLNCSLLEIILEEKQDKSAQIVAVLWLIQIHAFAWAATQCSLQALTSVHRTYFSVSSAIPAPKHQYLGKWEFHLAHVTHRISAGWFHDLAQTNADSLPLITLVWSQSIFQDRNDFRKDLLS